MSYLRLWVGRGCGHSEPASYEFRCAAWPSTPELRYCGCYSLMNSCTVPWYGTVGTVVFPQDKAEQDGGRGSCKKLAQRKNRRMRGCTG